MPSSLPPIEIRWGGGKWPNAPKRRLRPYVESAIELAQLSLREELGVASDVPKRASIWCVFDNNYELGSTDSATDMDLHVPYSFIRRPRKTSRLTAPLFLTAAHELMHTYRYEQGFRFSLAEGVFSEGLSMWGEYLVGQQLLCDGEFIDVPDCLASVAAADVEAGWATLLEDTTRLDAFELERGLEAPDKDSVYSEWFDPSAPDEPPLGYVLGMVTVGNLLRAGATFPEMLAMPTEEIIAM